MAYLEIKTGSAVLQSSLDEDAMSIGRLPGNSIVINDPDISRRHCVIERWEGKHSVYDLGSRNGTKVNGERIDRTELTDGDTISIGNTTIRFVAASLRRPASGRSWTRAATWVVALPLFLLAVFIAAWAAGLLGSTFTLSDLRARLGLSRGSVTPAESGVAGRSTTAPSRTAPNAGGGETIETSLWADRYLSIMPDSISKDSPALIGKAVTASFFGKPVLDEHGSLLWELPPDGAVTAVLEADGGEAARVLTTLAAEPMLMEVNLAGVLEHDPTGAQLLLKVGVVEVLHAWGGKDESLLPATQRLIGQRAIINPQHTARVLEGR